LHRDTFRYIVTGVRLISIKEATMRNHINHVRRHDNRRHRGEFPEGAFGGGHFDPRVARPGPPPPFPPGGFPGFPGRPGFPGGFGGRHGHRGHGRGRARRGNVRTAVLALLAERSMHGYEMIQEIAERSGGFWRVSPGSVYPTLQLLADEGLITSGEESGSGKRLYSLTEDGRAAAEKQGTTPPWEQFADEADPNEVGLREAAGLLLTAVTQVSQAASSEQKAQAVKALTEARQRLYLILAEAADPGDAGDPSEPAE
jgi:DNA-binding PadR family transcriptional regulator